MKLRNALIAALALAFAAGCSQGTNETVFPESQPEVKASDDIKSSFRAVHKAKAPSKGSLAQSAPGSKLKADVNTLNMSIHTDALEKEFLFRGSLIMQNPIPNFSGLKSRVVAFKRVQGDRLLMVEATDGHNVSQDLQSHITLAEFKIEKEENGWLEFDFNKGMSKLFLAGDWYAQDFGGSAYQDSFGGVETRISYLDDISFDKDRIAVKQVAQVVAGGWSPTVVAKYYLNPYRPSTDFEPTLSKRSNFKHFAFFETAPLLTHDGVTKIHATKFNKNKPIVFAISSNTPAEYRDAVKEGILYFNKIYKKDLIQVVDAPVGEVAPSIDYNIVQWADWDTAGFAYADAQSDPRTGEIQNAQVFFTSVFAIGSRISARRILQKIETAPAAPSKILGLQGFIKEHHCLRNAYDAQMRESLTALVNSNATDEQIMEVSKDYIREVVAHEIGHTLGLRHNFAASLAMDYDLKTRRHIHNEYVVTKKAKADIVPATSVMEYNRFEEATLLGDLIEQGKTFSYDEKAINILYNGTNPDPDNKVLFCTDSHATFMQDCVRFDIGNSVTESAVWEEELALQSIPYSILETFIAAADPTPGREVVPTKNVMLSPKRISASILGQRAKLIGSMSEKARFLKIDRMFEVIGELNIEEVKSAQRSHVESEIKAVGGLQAIFKRVPDTWEQDVYDRVEELLATPTYAKGFGPGGNGYEFSADDKATILKTTKRLLTMSREEIDKLHLKSLGSITAKMIDSMNEKMAFDMAALLADNVQHYVFKTTGELITGTVRSPKDDKGNQKEILARLPVFHYEMDVRKSAASLLGKSSGEWYDWGQVEKEALKKQMTELLKEALKGEKASTFKLKDQSRELAVWLKELGQIRGSGGYMF